MRPDLPHVPLKAGLSPDNPPCPACGEPLFPWVGLPVGTGVAHRCEGCGLGVMVHSETPARPDLEARFDPGTTEGVLASLDEQLDEDGSLPFSNPRSFQSALTGGAWAPVATTRPYLFTRDALEHLAARRDQVVAGTGWQPLPAILLLWQSLINMFTFGKNTGLGAVGRAHAVPGRQVWHRALDWFITIALAIPALIAAIPLELLGALFRSGGSCRARFTASASPDRPPSTDNPA